MMTRSAEKKNVHVEWDVLPFQNSDLKNRICTHNISIDSQTGIRQDKNQAEKPVFNIHFHMTNCEASNIKLYLPGVQPIVHFHLNEMSGSLKKYEKNKESNHQTLKEKARLLELPAETDETDLKIENSPKTQNRRVLRSSFGCLPGKPVAYAVKNKSDSVKQNNKSSPRKRQCNKSKSNRPVINKSISKNCESVNELPNVSVVKVLKPVVVLIDISKTKQYKELIEASVPKNIVQEKTAINGDTPLIKQDIVEADSHTPTSSLGGTERKFPGQLVQGINSDCISEGKILPALAEGCNFSDILRRFRLNCNNPVVYPLEDINKSNDESHIVSSGDKVLKECKNINQSLEVNEYHSTKNLDLDNSFSATKELDESKERLLYKSSQDNLPQSVEKQELTGERVHFLDQEEKGSDSEKCLIEAQPSLEFQFPKCQEIIHSHDTDVVDGDRSQISEISKPEVVNMSDSQFEEEKMRKPLRNTKSKTSRSKIKMKEMTKLTHSSKQKKRETNETSKEKGNKKITSMPADFIPLDASGPTKFGVAMLHQIEPYRRHDARDFKTKMLFGDRVTRFSSPNHLRKYKLKQEATRCMIETTRKRNSARNLKFNNKNAAVLQRSNSN